MHTYNPLEKSKRSLEALRKRMERFQKNIRRLYESADKMTGNPMQPARNTARD